MKTKEKHTPTQRYRIVDRGEVYPLRYMIQESFGPREIDWVTVLDTSKKERAELVVSSVNEYDSDKATIKALLEAAKRARSVINYHKSHDEHNLNDLTALERLDKAIAQAERV